MARTLMVETQVLGSRQKLPEWVVAYPAEWQVGGEDVPLREVIEVVVREEAVAFNERQEARRLASALSLDEITRAARSGKVDMGRRPVTKADPDESVRVALQAFEDGMYLVFVDSEQATGLNTVVRIGPDTRLRFVRLVMLAGG
jgi:hypothetical protein